MYKYFTWKSGKYFRGQELLSICQINSMISCSIDIRKHEAFSTIQNYNSEGDILNCPMYFDIDSTSLYDAYKTTSDLVQEVECEYDIIPYAWFSGSKGFHVIVPFEINGKRCHDIAKIISKMFTDDADDSVYRARSMWRLSGSLNDKSGMFKIPVDISKGLDEIIKMASNGFIDQTISYSLKTSDKFNSLCKDIEKSLPEINYSINNTCQKFDGMENCMVKIWENNNPKSGERHRICHLMSRFFFGSGMSKEEAILQFANHEFWKTVDDNDYKKVLTSVYRSGRSFIGCKNGSDSELLKANCCGLCVFQDDILDKIWQEK